MTRRGPRRWGSAWKAGEARREGGHDARTTATAQLVEHDRPFQQTEVLASEKDYRDPVFEAYGDYYAFGPYSTYEPEYYPFELEED